MTIDNFEILSSLLPETFDGDTFWYTELLDRSKRSLKNTDKIILGPVSNDAAKPAVSVWVDGLLLEVLFFALLRAGDVITLEPGCFRIGIETCAHI